MSAFPRSLRLVVPLALLLPACPGDDVTPADTDDDSTSTGEPVAEAWYGAHPKAPATAVTAAESVPLDAWIGEGELPYLLKLLAASKPLSIQVHPNAAQAAAGFAAEEAAGIPIDAPHRGFRDANHKPEVLVALTEFEALCGFRSQDGIEAAIGRLPELAGMLPSPSEGIEALLRAWFECTDQEVTAALGTLMTRLEAASPEPGTPEAWALRAHRGLEGDPDRGLLLVFLLELVHLQPGQAIFLPAGVPHAYLHGAGVELMASSDNVLRAGLTPKFVDPKTLLDVVRFDARRPVVLDPIVDESGAEAWAVPATELDLIRWRLDATQARSAVATGLETLLVIAREPGAKVEVGYADGTLALASGEAGPMASRSPCAHRRARTWFGFVFRRARSRRRPSAGSSRRRFASAPVVCAGWSPTSRISRRTSTLGDFSTCSWPAERSFPAARSLSVATFVRARVGSCGRCSLRWRTRASEASRAAGCPRRR